MAILCDKNSKVLVQGIGKDEVCITLFSLYGE